MDIVQATLDDMSALQEENERLKQTILGYEINELPAKDAEIESLKNLVRSFNKVTHGTEDFDFDSALPSPSEEDKPLGEITTHHEGVHIASPAASIPSFPAPPEMTAENLIKCGMDMARKFEERTMVVPVSLAKEAMNLRAAEAVREFAKEMADSYGEHLMYTKYAQDERVHVKTFAKSYITNKLK